jgi:nucleoside 2-deoxyribosyltransferase
MTQKRIYIAGPMTNLPNFNFPEFFQAAKALTIGGWDVVNPAQHDLDTGSVSSYFEGAEGDLMTYAASEDFDLTATLLWDLNQVAKCDAIYMLDGWENSKGATAEIGLAKALGKEIIYQNASVDTSLESETEYQRRVAVEKASSEVRTTSSTGGMKGKKRTQVSALDPLALKRVAEVAGFGAEKYDRLNYLKGFDWSLAYDALFRHTLDALNGDDYDEESGLLNLAHAVWQGLALISFHERGLGNDDRYNSSDIAQLQTKQTS